MITAIACLGLLGLLIGSVLVFASTRLAVEDDPLVSEIEAMMPGSQCGQCGYAGCGAAANAIASGNAAHNACPPGGNALAVKIAALMGVVISLDTDEAPKVATVGEELCIGCTKCFRACPTDAIVGAPKQIHSVITEHCTACGLCVDACPTETVTLQPKPDVLADWRWPKPSPRAA